MKAYTSYYIIYILILFIDNSYGIGLILSSSSSYGCLLNISFNHSCSILCSYNICLTQLRGSFIFCSYNICSSLSPQSFHMLMQLKLKSDTFFLFPTFFSIYQTMHIDHIIQNLNLIISYSERQYYV